MKYQINTTNYHTFHIFELNKLAPRSYFIPFSSRKAADEVSDREKRYASDKVVCLNGQWDFAFYANPKDLPKRLDTETVSFDKIDVPSCWQFRGYDRPFYVNTRYQFPYNPPKIPTMDKVGKVFSWMGSDLKIKPRFQTPEEEYNFVGVYRRDFEVADEQKNYVLSFLGVASCADVYVNGEFVGYSEGSHNTAEFDISKYIKKGSNELLVVVHRWCTGTYLEAQDMFRNNGIFRDVLLRISEPQDFFDIDFQTKKTKGGYQAILKVVVYQDTPVTFTIQGHGVSKTMTVQSKDGEATAVFEDLKVQEWNAEDPILYDVYYETSTACVKVKAGFKEVRIEGTVFKVNGRAIKFHGVNHHDTSCTNGFTMTPEELERDVKLCKEFNIDTMRMSHYPPDPYLLELCDRYGIYVVDETDLETHGTFSQTLPPSYNRISHDPKWESHFVDRVRRMYQRDKLHTSVVLWSLGNEAGGYYNTDKEYEYLKKHTDIPVHYESVIHSRRKAYDVGSQMYPSVERVHEVGEKTCKVRELNDRPYFLCEYAHAMGVGPGNIESYWKEIYAHENLMGGCVWEMVDHAVLHEDGSYTYGGDHGEWEHDGNFCVDGIFYPDRKPSTGAYIVKHTYRPIRITHVEGNTYEVFNTTGFSEGSRYRLNCRWSDGGRATVIPTAGPMEKVRMEIIPEETVVPTETSNDLMLTIDIIDTREESVTATEQFLLEERMPSEEAAGAPVKRSHISLMDGKVTFTLDGETMCTGNPGTILFRAATDNDADVMMRNTMETYYDQKEKVVNVEWKEHGLEVQTEILTAGKKFLCTDTYTECTNGILVSSKLHCVRGKGMVPRFGKTFCFQSSYEQVEYVGRSGESYCDMKEQWPIQAVSCKVADMTEPNIRPQESGNRCDCSEVTVSNGKTKVTFEAVDKKFELSVKPYTDRELISMKHREDEKVTGTYVTINAFQMGIGTGSCGPVTAKEYCYPVNKDYEIKFFIRWGCQA